VFLFQRKSFPQAGGHVGNSTKLPNADFLEKLPDPRPVMVTRQELPKLFPGMTARTWANLAYLKQGPKFYRRKKLTWYVVDDVIEYLTQNPIQTTSGGNL